MKKKQLKKEIERLNKVIADLRNPIKVQYVAPQGYNCRHNNIFEAMQEGLKDLCPDLDIPKCGEVESIQPSDNKTEEKKEFDWQLNKKFAEFNGWSYTYLTIDDQGGKEFAYASRGDRQIKGIDFDRKFNYLEDPKLIQETIDNLTMKGYVDACLFREDQDRNIVFEDAIDKINEKETEADKASIKHRNNVAISGETHYKEVEKSYNEGFEAGRKQPKSKEFWEEIQKEHEAEILEAERKAFEAGRIDDTDPYSCKRFKYTDFEDYQKSKTSTEKNIHN